MILVWFFIGFIPGHLMYTLSPKMKHYYGLDKPWYLQILDFFGGFFTGNWGRSITYQNTEVFDLIRIWFPRTIEIAIIPMIIVNITAAKLGRYSAVNRGKKKDYILQSFALISVSLPIFWVALLFQFLFRETIPAITFGIIDLPIVGLYSTKYILIKVPYVTGFRTIDTLLNNQLDLFVDTLLHLIVPALVFFVATFGGLFRSCRSCMLDVINEDYIRTARAKGCLEKAVVNKHAFRNALMPWSTFIGFNVGYLISGAAIIEIIFDFGGIGKGLIIGLVNSDYFLIRGCVVIFCLVNIVVNLTIDVLYAIIDPRVRYS
jgi:ABC-type dipeptide/oligopeptide/nickel transport system permease component